MLHAVRRFVPVALMLALVLSVFGSTKQAAAQGQNNTAAPGQWQSSINLQNFGTGPATAVVVFYGPTGNEITRYAVQGTIPQNGAVSIFVPAQVSALPSGQYSAAVESDQPIKASVNTASTNSSTGPFTAFGYEGIESADAGATLYFPGLYKSYYNFFSEIVIQNADTQSATVTARFYNRSGAQIAGPIELGTVAANASKTFTTASLGALPSGDLNGVFGAVVTSNEGRRLVGIANIWRTAPTNGTSSYNAFTGGSSTLYAPALYKNYYGFGSALSLQAIGGAASGTIVYSNGTQEPFTLQANAAQEFYQPADNRLPSGDAAGVFSARVNVSSGQVVGLVSLSVPTGERGDFASYNVPDQAANQVNVPNVLSDYFGYFSAVTVQNTSNFATDVTITYGNGQSRSMGRVAANQTVNIIHLNNAGDVLPDSTTTSAVVSGSGGAQLVAVVQHNTTAGVNGFNPAKVPSDFLIALSGSAR